MGEMNGQENRLQDTHNNQRFNHLVGAVVVGDLLGAVVVGVFDGLAVGVIVGPCVVGDSVDG